MKKYTSFLLLLVLFCLDSNTAYAYQFENPNNESLVSDRINEIYSMREQYEDLIGGYEEVEVIDVSSNSYWWPIGSSETTVVDGKVFANADPEKTVISSNYGYRDDPFGRGKRFHSGLDIANLNGAYGTTNIIAAKDGIVVYPTASIENNCQSSDKQSTCGDYYGNYVIIQHSDGNYTLYGHMYENSITVTAGDSVHQGQVIGKMGSSGSSTGAHLHFEVREGENLYGATVDPLNYVSMEEPRKSLSGDGELLSWLNSWEGHTPIDGDFYIVQNIGDGVRSVGSGITLENTANIFARYGIDVSKYPVGSRLPISIVDQVELDVLSEKRSYIEGILSNNSITLEETQIQALISQTYNIGNITGFVSAYKTYGNTEELYNNWFFRAVMKGTQFEAGLTRRRNAEWALFNSGKYIYNG